MQAPASAESCVCSSTGDKLKTKAPKLSDKEERNVTSRIFRVSVHCRCSPAGMWYETESLNIIGSLFYIEYYVDNSAVRVRRRTITHCIVDFSCSICEGRQREERSLREGKSI